MKPKDLYSGAAPAAMAQMGAGLSEAGARIGQINQQKYETLGKNIGGVIQGVASVYAQHKELKASNDANKKLLDNPKVQEMFGITKDQANQMKVDADNLGTKEAAKMFESFIPMAFKSALQQRSDQAQSMQAWNTEEARAAYKQVAPPIYDSGMPNTNTPFAQQYNPDNSAPTTKSVSASYTPAPLPSGAGVVDFSLVDFLDPKKTKALQGE